MFIVNIIDVYLIFDLDGVSLVGVRHAREYADILADLTEAVLQIPDGHLFIDMTTEEWGQLAPEERREVMEALADDVFFGLGEDPLIRVGSAAVAYDSKFHRIVVRMKEQIAAIVPLT
ncbi:hypothetical protein PAE9249_05330 [Paenibacillus sp. CECT 9249]|nr:hypothetical protein [Paenibacillus sp. MSJ-34]CAH0122739.1 hypothetical protein PAE9249_05330 [Paenibacillus sp. CECT 9249]